MSALRRRFLASSSLTLAFVVLGGGCGGSPSRASSAPALSSVASAAFASPTGPESPDDDDDDTPKRRVVAESTRRHTPWNDPLPHGALVRFGTNAFDHGFSVAVAVRGGEMLSATMYEGRLHRWDPKTGDVLATAKLDVKGTFTEGDVSADGTRVALVDEKSLYVVDAKTLALRFKKDFFDGSTEDGAAESVAFHPDGRIAVGLTNESDSRVLRILDRAGNETTSIEVARPKESYMHTRVTRLAFSPDGSLLAAVATEKARLYAFPAGNEIATFSAGVSAEAIAFSHDGKRLYVGGYGAAVNAFDTKTFTAVRSFGFLDYEKDGNVETVDVSPDDRFVAVGAREVRIYDTATSAEVGRFPRIAAGHRVSFPTPKIVSYPVDDPVAIGRFDLENGKAIAPSISAATTARSWAAPSPKTARPSTPSRETRRFARGTRRQAHRSPHGAGSRRGAGSLPLPSRREGPSCPSARRRRSARVTACSSSTIRRRST